jgi:hypothetical protein
MVEKDAVRRLPTDEERRLMRQHFKMLAKAIKDGFDGVARKRGQIVHQDLYSDAELSRIDILDFYVQHGDDDAFADFAAGHDETYRQKRGKVAREIERSQGEVEKAIAETLAQLEPLLLHPRAKSDGRDP